MSTNQHSSTYAKSDYNSAAVCFQTANSYAALVATAGPEHDGRSSSPGSPSSFGSYSPFFACNEGQEFPTTPSRFRAQSQSSLSMPQQRVSFTSPAQLPPSPACSLTDFLIQTYGSPEHTGVLGFAPIYSTSTRKTYVSPTEDFGLNRTVGRVPDSSATYHANLAPNHQEPHNSTLSGVPESVSVQEMAFRQGQQDSSSSFTGTPTNPFAQPFDQLWKTFYFLGKEYGNQRTPTPVNLFQKNFDWPILINPYTQSLKNPRGSLDPAWSRKMIEAALNCMEELVRIICRRNVGWDKTVADIPLPAQEALVAFPDLAQCYEQLKRAAQQARAGGRPAGF